MPTCHAHPCSNTGGPVVLDPEPMMKPLITLILAAAFVLSACNTVQGVGRDIEKAGEEIQKAGSK
jgi:entericidin A